MRRQWKFMTNLKRKLLAVAVATFVSAGAFSQKKEDKRPPKPENTKVVAQPKGEKPPQNNNQGKKSDEKKGKP